MVTKSPVRSHDHVVQFYETDTFLVQVVAPFLAAGLRRGGTALIVCTIEHRSALSAALNSAGIDVQQLRQQKDLVWLDARSLLQHLRMGDPSAVFQREIGDVVKRLDRGDPQQPIHIFGELVDLLWAGGLQDTAVSLEAMWNTLSQHHNFSLFCSYRMTPSRATSAALKPVCAAHSHVLRPQRAGSVRVLDDLRGQRARYGEKEMVFASRRRNQQVADSRRDDLAQTLFGLILQAQGIKENVPAIVRPEMDEFIRRTHGLLETLLELANDLAPEGLQSSSLVDALEKYAAMTERLFDVGCQVKVAKAFLEPDRMQRELLYAIAREVIDRAVRQGGSKQIRVKLSRNAAWRKLAIYHDGDCLVAIGADDDAIRRLVYQSRALGAQLRVGAKPRSNLQLVCRW
jgi:MEDS: MEthanogen/methylotroph, DcmR Sensory domain